MIRVNRPDEPPAILATRGAKAFQKHCQDYDEAPDEHRSGSRLFAFPDGIFNARSVKDVLLKAQHRKCCYCERKAGRRDLDVEHYRPKAAYRRKPGAPLQRPGYYWLAYEWSNLLIACKDCNEQHKANAFPLATGSKRAASHHDDVQDERPLLIDPAAQDLAEYVRFRGAFLYAIGGNPIGRTTIKTLRLNDRPELAEARRFTLGIIKLLKENRDALASEIAAGRTSRGTAARLRKLDAQLAEFVQDSAEYAAMARAALNP